MTYHCRGCTRRTATCHASCEDYANDKKLAEKEREAKKGPTESVRLYKRSWIQNPRQDGKTKKEKAKTVLLIL